MGRIEALWIKTRHGGAMEAVESAILERGAGIVGNADRGGRRQVTLLERERWEAAVAAVGRPVEPSARRANVLLHGVDLKARTGRLLRLGACLLRIEGETDPCAVMDAAADGLQEALRPDWRGGAYGVVLEGGTVEVGDVVRWED